MNLFEHTSAHWARYADYQWRKVTDGQLYLLPIDSAEATVYDPISLVDQLVTDVGNIGLLVFHKQPDSEIQTAIRNFACAYGLLGLMTALPTTPRFVEYENVYLLKNPYICQESMDTLTYLKLFFPFRMPDFHKRGTKSLWNVFGEDKMQAALAMTFRNEPKTMSFMRNYGERYDWLKEVFLDWAFTFISAYMYYNDRDILDQDTLALYRQGLACFEGNAPSYHLELRDHTVIVWDFHSLMLAVKFLFSVRLTDPDNPMKLCAHCRKAFIARRTDLRFFSVECRLRAARESNESGQNKVQDENRDICDFAQQSFSNM